MADREIPLPAETDRPKSDRPGWLAGLSSDQEADRFISLWQARDAQEGGPDLDICGEILGEVAGVDPVLAVAEGRAELIPASGWLVNCYARPGWGGTIRVTRYDEGGFTPESCSGNREQHSRARLHYRLEGGSYHDREIAYENPGYPDRDIEPCERFGYGAYLPLKFEEAEVSRLENGGRIIARSKLFRGARLFAAMDWQPVDDVSSAAPINRIAASPAEVEAIVGQIGVGMGLGPEDAQSLVTASTDKFTQSPAETALPHPPGPFGSAKPPAPAPLVDF